MKNGSLRVEPGRPVRLAELDPRSTPGFADKDAARDTLLEDVDRLFKLQDVFAAASTHALLIVLQGMDSAGKDGVIKHVMSGVNPQGIDVHSFKTPTPAEERHDFLWRCATALPERGRIAIFNRSYYEEVLVERVHPEMLALEAAPSHDVWTERFEDINAFERHLARNGTIVLKFFLHLSRDEQRRRLLARLDEPQKNWKFSMSDVAERRFWDEYQHAYEAMLAATSTAEAPWYVIPADRKWFVRAAVGGAIVAALERLNLCYPALSGAAAAQLAELRARIESDAPKGAK